MLRATAANVCFQRSRRYGGGMKRTLSLLMLLTALVCISVLMTSPYLQAESADPLISFRPQGRLGNSICEYVHLLYLHKMYSVKAALHPNMWASLHEMFPELSLNLISRYDLQMLDQRPVVFWDALREFEQGARYSALLTGTPCRVWQLLPLRQLWRKELTFSTTLKNEAARREAKLIDEWLQLQHHPPTEKVSPPTLVGVHVRRGDMEAMLVKYNSGALLPPEYYNNAFNYFRNKFESVLFLVFSEPKQRLWCEQQLAAGVGDVTVINDRSSAAQDMAFLSSLKHFVYSHGTFGLWAILLSDAQTVVYPEPGPDPTSKRYSHHQNFDKIRHNLTEVNFVTVSAN